ncbi:YgcG family protein [Arcobacter sp. s6]|uniref:YgcG family protein n=1 Tax=Arcobacter sp. s6 TaxID=3230363 RepID=UPI0034A0ACB7
MKKTILILTLLISTLFADITQYFPKLDGRVVDTANLLSSNAKEKITTTLKEHENKTSNQIVVVTLKSLNGYEIEEFSYQLGRFWGIGQKDLNNGVLLVIALEEKKLRIEVGYGLEGALTDKISYEIINYTLKPKFRLQDYDAGITNAVNEIIQAIKGEYTVKTKVKDEDMEMMSETLPLVFFGIIFLSIFLNGISTKTKNQFLYKTSKSSILSSFFGFFTFIMAQSFTSFYIIIAAIVFIGVFIFNFINIRNVDFNKIKEASRNSSNSRSGGFGGGGFSSNGGGFSSSGGGFSGGGGGFGGGGASGGW